MNLAFLLGSRTLDWVGPLHREADRGFLLCAPLAIWSTPFPLPFARMPHVSGSPLYWDKLRRAVRNFDDHPVAPRGIGDLLDSSDSRGEFSTMVPVDLLHGCGHCLATVI